MKINTELGQAIRDLILCKFKLNYTGNIEVREITYLDNGEEIVIGYELRLGNPKLPAFVSIVKYGSKKAFLNFIEQELQDRHLEAIKYYSVRLTYGEAKDGCGTNQ
jgi:hypothetical protein